MKYLQDNKDNSLSMRSVRWQFNEKLRLRDNADPRINHSFSDLHFRIHSRLYCDLRACMQDIIEYSNRI